LEELKRHNCIIEDHGVYLAPDKRGRGVITKKIKKIKKINVKQLSKMPKSIITNVQLQQLAKHMRIPYFRDIFILFHQQGECIESKYGLC